MHSSYSSSLSYTNGGIANQSVCTGEEPILSMDKGDGHTPREATYMYNIEKIISSSLSDSYITDFPSTSTMMNILSTSMMTGPSPIVTPTGSAAPVLMCFSDGTWPDTPVNQTANGTCSKGIANGNK